MAELAIYQHHERTSTGSLENDLQLREIGIDPQAKFITAHSEYLGAKLHGITVESPTISLQGVLTLSADPVNSLLPVLLQYLQPYVSSLLRPLTSGIQVTAAVACATTGAITLSGEQTIDGVATSSSRVLVKDQGTSAENGIYLSSSGAWSRAFDCNTDDEFPGALTFVSDGTSNGSTQ